MINYFTLKVIIKRINLKNEKRTQKICIFYIYSYKLLLLILVLVLIFILIVLA